MRATARPVIIALATLSLTAAAAAQAPGVGQVSFPNSGIRARLDAIWHRADRRPTTR